MSLFLVRHGRPLIDRARPAHEWELDPAGFDEVWALRESGRLPRSAIWFTSPEPKAVGTAQLLTDSEVGVIDELREMVRNSADWIEDIEAVVRRAFVVPDVSAYDGWEPLAACRERVVPAVRQILDSHVGGDIVLVGHGTAWTALVAALTDQPPDLTAGRGWTCPT